MTASSALAEWKRPTAWSATLFAVKVALLRARRLALDVVNGPRRLPQVAPEGFSHIITEVRSPLWSDQRAAERSFQEGKVANLRRAAELLDGSLIDAGQVFSFWRQLGPASAARGFVAGRMLQQGCLVPAVGGGLCQLSNAIYQAGRAAGCDIVERHRHSRLIPGSEAELGRDATVAWNYVDLRLRAPVALRLEVRTTEEELVVGLWSERPVTAVDPDWETEALAIARTCATCEETDCFRHEERAQQPS